MINNKSGWYLINFKIIFYTKKSMIKFDVLTKNTVIRTSICIIETDLEQHHETAHHLDAVRDQHHLALRHGIGKGAEEGREDDIEQREHRAQRRDVPGR